MPGIADEIDGAVQQAPQPARQAGAASFGTVFCIRMILPALRARDLRRIRQTPVDELARVGPNNAAC
jgi:hypothetical protein